MAKYNNDLIDSYINGDDIDDIEVLENDEEFMKEVINKTDDKNFYNLCSLELKHNHDFIRYLIEKYSDDKEFISKVLDNYLENNKSEESIYHLDLVLLVYSLTKKEDYKVIADSIYRVDRVKVEVYKLTEEDEEKKDFIGMGFVSIFDLYHDNEMVLDYYAKNLLGDIFLENEIDMDGLMHNRFKSSLEIEQMGIRTFLINFIESFDDMLSSYISTHIYLLDELVKKGEKVIKNWDKYNKVTEIRKINRIFYKIHDYYKECEHLGTLSEDQILYYIGKKLNILDKLRREDFESLLDYYDEYETEDNNVEWNYEDEVLEQEIRSNLANRMIVNNALKIAENVLYPKAPTQQEIDLEKNGGKNIRFK